MKQELMTQLADLDKQFEQLELIRNRAQFEVDALQSDLQQLGGAYNA
ncbi:hypothetical protein RYX56_05540 [Alkalihalophilus lindianensis]|uniref:Uncharacterized protein n=1 Tax=Alkalihalophilus lindianensis TaxID=1630542 RepID=A0ABU3X876_9BACI|nr:hypothetical protein [Alkalihalophilus lindianensis]MDV2683771.1 hypothetical protein [Alkalihalophilus lindianensis]MDV2683837.1 hypothetical protein [Alkalihalophilus lindianensis]